MRRLIKDQDGNVAELISIESMMIPPGWELVPEEDLPAAELAKARENKLGAIRSKRDAMLMANDKAWTIASKKGEPVEAILADAQLLRDLPEGAEDDLNNLELKADIESYDPFPSLGLSREY